MFPGFSPAEEILASTPSKHKFVTDTPQAVLAIYTNGHMLSRVPDYVRKGHPLRPYHD